MKRSKYIGLSIWVLLFACLGCDDILENDISDDALELIFPLTGDQIVANEVNFQWNSLEDADSYRVQVFGDDLNDGILIDSLVTTLQLKIDLAPGGYTWTARAENFAYTTEFVPAQSFDVLFTDDLSGQTVNLLTPSNDFYTNDVDITCTWEAEPAALQYDFELQKSLNGITTVLQEANIEMTSFGPPAVSFEEDAQYIWKVRAKNSTTQTEFAQRNLFIDREAPPVAALSVPGDQATFNVLSVTMAWILGQDVGNVTSDRKSVLEIASDASFNVIVDTIESSDDFVDYTFTQTGDYFWRVKIIDIAGNESAFSTVRQFTLN